MTPTDSDDPMMSPWHDGEREIQARVGARERSEAVGRHAIRPFMPDQHRSFFAQLPFVVAGSVDRAGQVWASILSGPPGFATSPDPHLLRVAARPVAGDPLTEALVPSGKLGLLGIELPTRRRNRANGRVAAIDDSGFTLAVEQSFGNCPQYIQRREYVAPAPRPAEAARVAAEELVELDAAARALIGEADTLFVASAARDGVDVSHRGGRPGFVGIAADGAIVVPDYRGNRYFNTLGNFVVNPRAGLLFVDFARGDLLQVTGATEIVWSGAEVDSFAGAERLWRLMPSHGRWLRGALSQRLVARDPSPTVLATGTWREAQARLTADPAVPTVRSALQHRH